MFKKLATLAAVLTAGGAAVIAAGPLRAQDASRSIWEGVFTEEQVARGEQQYLQNCGSCHGAQLGGTGEAPPVSGPEFMSNWNGLSLRELFDRIRTTMPLDRPGTMSREAYADVLAYVLKHNGLPAGQKELDRRSEFLSMWRIDAQKPANVSAAPAAGSDAAAQAPAAAPAADPAAAAAAAKGNSYPNPYARNDSFFKLPAGRTMGSSSAVAVDSKGHIWVAERCGANSCADSAIDPIMEFDANGNFIKAFGKGMFLFPHGMFIDSKDRIWLTDGQMANGKGNYVVAFDRNGKVLMTLGKPGVAGDRDLFTEPNSVVVAPNGTIFVADGHSPAKGPARIVKFDANGKYVKEWGVRGPGGDQLEVPHALAMDTSGRLFVGDRWNNRIQIYDQDGKLLDSWKQFGRPSGLYIDRNDVLYVADSESRHNERYGHNPGWNRGIRIGSAKTGEVTSYIPDTFADPEKTATSGPEGIYADANGRVFGAEVQQKAVIVYTKK